MPELAAYVAKSLAGTVPREIEAMAEHIRAGRADVAAVLAYGSCLRGVDAADTLIDLYVLTRHLDGVSPSMLSRFGCRLAPPNVYYAEAVIAGQRHRAKYAVLPMDLFRKWMSRGNPYLWARFSQPSALVYCAGNGERQETVNAVVNAIETAYGHARAMETGPSPVERWEKLFTATYRTELRAERGSSRARHVVEANEDYYRTISAIAANVAARRANWWLRRYTGKLWSIVRLIKAAFTFAGAADYIAWKIERHSGQKIRLNDWQRRHPILAGFVLLPKLLAKRAVR